MLRPSLACGCLLIIVQQMSSVPFHDLIEFPHLCEVEKWLLQPIRVQCRWICIDSVEWMW